MEHNFSPSQQPRPRVRQESFGLSDQGVVRARMEVCLRSQSAHFEMSPQFLEIGIFLSMCICIMCASFHPVQHLFIQRNNPGNLCDLEIKTTFSLKYISQRMGPLKTNQPLMNETPKYSNCLSTFAFEMALFPLFIITKVNTNIYCIVYLHYI